MIKILIAAVAKNGVIGKASGEMPWESKEEFQHFRNSTLGYPIIMGRKTFESLGNPLKGRTNIIITRNKEFITRFNEVKIFQSLEEAYLFCWKLNSDKIFIIGGGEIFREAIKTADQMIISKMNFDAEGEVFFPHIEKSIWVIIKSEKRSEFDIIYYERKDVKKDKDTA